MNCTLCKLCERRTREVPGEGNPKAKIVFIGIGPGYEEDRVGRPFVGPSGRLFMKALSKVGLRREEVFLTNLVRCIPLNENSEIIDPPRECVETCSKYLNEELSSLQEKNVVVLLGSIVTKAILKERKNESKIRGHVYVVDGCKYVCTLHPAFVYRNPNLFGIFLEDLEKIKRESLTKEPLRNDFEYEVIRDVESLSELKKKLLSVEAFAFDLETSGVRYQKDHILTISFCYDGNKAYVVPLRNCGGSLDLCFPEDVIRDFVVDVFSSNVKKIAHNGKFDCHFLRKYCYVENLYFDTMIAHYLIEEGAEGYHDLKSLASVWLDMEDYTKDIERYKSSLTEAPLDIVARYTAADAVATFRLYLKFLPKIRELELSRLYFQLCMPLLRVLEEIERNGMKVDLERLKEFRKSNEERMKEIEDRIRREFGEINLKSSKQVQDLLFGKLALRAKVYTPKGNPSTSFDALVTLENESPIVKDIVTYRKLQVLTNSFIKGIEKFIDEDGRVRTTYSMHRTETGRLATTDPAMHAIPNTDEARSCFVAEEGYTLVEMDYKQAEVRIWANTTGDETLLNDLMSSDIYKTIAARVYRKDVSEITKKERDPCKGVILGLMYGRGARSVAEELKIDVKEAQDLIDRLFSTYKKAYTWMVETKRKARTEHYVRNIFGRIRRLYAFYTENGALMAEAEREALNAPIQSGSSDYVNLVTIRLHQRFKKENLDAKIVLSIHDALLFEIKDEHLDRALEVIKEEALRGVEGLIRGLDIEFKIGKRWGTH